VGKMERVGGAGWHEQEDLALPSPQPAATRISSISAAAAHSEAPSLSDARGIIVHSSNPTMII
jgi:hypothetical protein